MFNIDGWVFNFPIDVSRTTDMYETEVSGMLMNLNYYHDLRASFVKYSVKLAIPRGNEQDYSRLYNLLIQPSEHYFTLPFNQEEIEFRGIIKSVSDKLIKQVGGVNIWHNISFDIESSEPRLTV